MAYDALQVFQAQVTKTATFNGAALTLPGGTPRRGMAARIEYSAAANASGSNTITFSVDVSFDGGSTWYSDFVAADKAIALSTTAQSGQIRIPFFAKPTSVTNGVQVRLTPTFSGAGSGATITYSAELILNA
ncbi:MAG TPA: hypothetical protein VHL10_00850 [Nitrososphaera sp.]|jgi:hypothetical protein|nr:hypothetical protein [Nitrososphaera sp.]